MLVVIVSFKLSFSFFSFFIFAFIETILSLYSRRNGTSYSFTFEEESVFSFAFKGGIGYELSDQTTLFTEEAIILFMIKTYCCKFEELNLHEFRK